MPYVKSTIHVSRIANTAIKTFTHGYAQTVTALAAQNHNSSTPLQDTLVGRFRKTEKSKLGHVYQNVENIRHASSSATASSGIRPETSSGPEGLDKYYLAWHKHQRQPTKDWQQFQFARTIEWQPPSVVPANGQEHTLAATAEEVHVKKNQDLAAPLLKRSYTTSALDNFGKAFVHDEALEAAALEQVNNAIAVEIQKSKDDAGDALMIKTQSASSVSDQSASFQTEQQSVESPATVFTPTDSFTSTTSQVDAYAQELQQLVENEEYHEIPEVFQAMLRAGVQKPAPSAYRALLTSAVELTHGQQRVPKALEVYSDMLRRKVMPDIATFGIFIDLLAQRATQAKAMRKNLEERLTRYGGLEAPGKFMFGSTQSEHTMLLEDSSLSRALKMFDRAASSTSGEVLPSAACAALMTACAEQGHLGDMTKIYEHMESKSMEPQSSVFPPMITAFGQIGDLKRAVEVYDEYKDLAIANNAGTNTIARNDNQIYAALIMAYGSADRLKGGLKFLSTVQSESTDPVELENLREVVALQALLPLALKDETFRNAFDLTQSLTGRALYSALTTICNTAADRNLLDVSVKAFDTLAAQTQDLALPATAMLAMHVRNANVEAAEPYWRILETAPATIAFIEPTTMRTIALVGIGQAERGLRHSRRMFGRIRDTQAESKQPEAVEQIDEAIELIASFMLKSSVAQSPSISIELLRMMTENGALAPVADHIIARLGADQIARLSPADLEYMTRVQGAIILDSSSTADIAGPARFDCLLQNIVSRSVMPSVETETMIERTLINVNSSELSRLWNNYRYPPTPAALTAPLPFSPVVPHQAPPAPFLHGQQAFDDSYDPYAHRTDVKGSNAINELLERPQGRRIQEALTKFRNMRRVGRVPRMFTYGKLIEGAAKEHNLALAHEMLELAKQDVPFDARYRVVRFGWQQILDNMVAGCLTIGRRDLAARYHQDLVDMGAAPSANTFGLYITTLKENTKTFDEASEAVRIFLRAKDEGVEPSSFLYNALIGKLGKARRIDDCLFYFAEMRNLGIRPTSVTYGTIVNALVRVSDEKFAEEIFEEMESCSNYKPRPAPYHSLMQFFLSTKRDRGKVLSYYEGMRSKGIEPTVHTFKLLIDTHATLEPVNMAAAEAVLEDMRSSGIEPEAVHYASLIHAKGCVLHDLPAARALFDSVIADGKVRPQPCLYQALFESLNANHMVAQSEALLQDMTARGVDFTPYIANALIHGWTLEKNVEKAKVAFDHVSISRREPSTYEAMVRAYLAAEQRDAAKVVVREALNRGYPSAVAGKIAELVR
ncbi:hypothetical protein LTR09_006864 [Extremus antarcticus]|uniref:Tetratricopeptide repeat domain-containing protein n=1 Tax=Extremus antarcticus TaxID=702011 RepID=A0AAJ0DDM5_9PEZI|nr:hypothetical protein LTR09_006864 [Extremus antarcticus]